MSIKNKFVFLFILLAFNNSVLALELLLGINTARNSIGIEDKSRGDNEIAMMEGEFEFSPSIAARTEATYFANSNWGYHIQIDFFQFKIDKQEINIYSSAPARDLGTEMKGSSIYVVPVAFYHFNRQQQKDWNYKAGVGAGFGYLDLQGTFRITDSSHPLFNSVQNVDVSDIGMAGGVYFSAEKGNHLFVGQNYGPLIDDGQFQYQAHDVALSYKYRVNY